MFSRKKKNYTWIYVCGILAIVIVAVLILIGALSARNEDATLQTSLEKQAENSEGQSPPQSAPSDEFYNDSAQNERPAEKEQENQFYQSYYLVKLDNHVIKIFFSDETGKLIQLEETAIVYETLAPQDQQRFQEGIKAETRDDLNRLIMNYES